MAKYRLYDWGFNLIFVVLLFAFLWLAAGCRSDIPPASETKLDVNEVLTDTEFTYPVRTQYLTKNNCTYMIAATMSVDGGVAVRNLTLDSLQIRYYQMMLGN